MTIIVSRDAITAAIAGLEGQRLPLQAARQYGLLRRADERIAYLHSRLAATAGQRVAIDPLA